jgi:hypothetical protein
MRIFAQSSVLALCALLSGASCASADDAVIAKIVVGDGPFEVVGESGIFGFVVARKAKLVTFKPCTGDPFEIESKKLKRTKFKCEDGPSPDPHPLQVNCGDAEKFWDKEAAKVALEPDATLGSIFFEKDKTVKMVASASSDMLKGAFSKVAQFKDCGDWTVGFGDSGAPLVHVIKASEVNQIPYQDLGGLQ